MIWDPSELAPVARVSDWSRASTACHNQLQYPQLVCALVQYVSRGLVTNGSVTDTQPDG
jgi:hypothetical protein